MRPKGQDHGTTNVGFIDLKAFERFVREVGGVEIVVPETSDEPLVILTGERNA